MSISITEISKDSKIFVSESEKKIIKQARNRYVSGEDKGISLEESYKNFITKFNNLD